MSVGVRWGSFTMDGTADGNGDVFVIEDIEGLDAPEVDITSSDRYDDGNVLTSARFKQRELLIKGHAYAPSQVAWGAFRVRQKITSAFVDYRWFTGSLWIDIPSPGTAYVVNARLGGQIHFPTPTANVQPFEIPMTCDDPRLYGQTENNVTRSGGPHTFTNSGNYPTYITATYKGGASGAPWLENTTYGGRLTLSSAPPNNTVLNFLYREITVPGVGVQEYAATPRVWWPLLPGNNTVNLNGSFEIKHRWAWI